MTKGVLVPLGSCSPPLATLLTSGRLVQTQRRGFQDPDVVQRPGYRGSRKTEMKTERGGAVL